MEETLKIMNELKIFLINYIKENTSISKRGRADEDSYILHYYEYLDKVKMNVLHEIYYSREMKNKIKNVFKGELDAINQIERCLKTGQGIEPYLSKDARLGNIDELFNDWNILHCHLDNRKSEEEHLKGLNKRTGNVLMLMLVGNKAYFLDIFKHNMWTEKRLLEIIYRNWKELLHIFNTKSDIKGLTSKKDIKTARSTGIVHLITIEPYKNKLVQVLPNGSGMVTSRHPLRIVRKKGYIYQKLKDMLNHVIIENGVPKKYIFNYIYPELYIILGYDEIIRVLNINIMSFDIKIIDILNIFNIGKNNILNIELKK